MITADYFFRSLVLVNGCQIIYSDIIFYWIFDKYDINLKSCIEKFI